MARIFMMLGMRPFWLYGRLSKVLGEVMHDSV